MCNGRGTKIIKGMAQELLELSIKYGFDTIPDDMEDGHCKGVIVDSKDGWDYYEAKIFVDTAGDADIFRRARAPCRDGKNYYTYLMYGVTLGSMKNPKKLTYYVFIIFKVRKDTVK